jgi:hypothetical protein
VLYALACRRFGLLTGFLWLKCYPGIHPFR